MSARFDAWLAEDGPVALTVIEPLEPVTGENTVVYPPTFAPPEDKTTNPTMSSTKTVRVW